MARLDASAFAISDALFSEFKGSFAENYVLQALLSQLDAAPRYWTNEKPKHEVDFLIQVGNEIVPVEVKSGEAVHSKSLKYYKGRRVGINEVAERLYTSRSKLCATFKAQTGESLGAYIRRRRMERAQDLLADSALTIAQVAERLGYPQQAAFAQAFKQHTGTTPTGHYFHS